jgi:hypothetical protein
MVQAFYTDLRGRMEQFFNPETVRRAATVKG